MVNRLKHSKYIDTMGHEIITFVPGTRDLFCPICKKIYEKRHLQRLVSINGKFVSVARYSGYKNGRKAKSELLIKNGPVGNPYGRRGKPERRWPESILDVKRY